MPTENSSSASRISSAAALAIGWALCLGAHFYGISSVPGLHFDEAWAMNYAWRIASEPGFWPWQGMSPYTSPWAHYWAALWMKLLGGTVAVFRGSQVILSVVGLGAAGLALHRAGLASAARLWPWMALAVPGLFLNHRFAIELNGFHVAMLGLGLLALVEKRPWAAAACWVIGSTAHILFYAVGLALFAALVWQGRGLAPREKRALRAAAIAHACFFAYVLAMIPEKGKAAALLVSAVALFGLAGRELAFVAGIRARAPWVPFVLAAVFFFNAIFFAAGHWTAATFTGLPPWEQLSLAPLLTTSALLAVLFWRGSRGAPSLALSWLAFALVGCGLMMLKPAPRYFELPILGIALVATLGASLLAKPVRLLGVFVLMAQTAMLFLWVAWSDTRERDLRLLFFKDSSRDFLSKQSVASVLGSSGCGLSDINYADSRVMEALRAIAIADWPKAPGARCSARFLRVVRPAESVVEQPLVAGFVLEGWEEPK